MDDVADRAGVSRALVSLVMRNSPKVSDQRRDAVLLAAAELGYRPNASARSLAQQQTKTIGVVLNDLHNTFFADVVDGIHDAAVEAGYRLLLGTAWRQDADEQWAVEQFLEYRVDGVVVLGPRMDDELFETMGRAAPIVSIGRRVDAVDSVVNDDKAGGDLVASHLLDLGHRRIVHIDGGTGGGAKQRKAGFAAALERSGAELRVFPGDYSEGPAAVAVDQLLREASNGLAPLPTAIFAANDLSAIAALDRLKTAGVDVPGHVSVVGYDDTSMAALSYIQLSTINQPRYEMGKLGFASVLARIATPKLEPVAHVLEPQLVARGTSGPASTQLD